MDTSYDTQLYEKIIEMTKEMVGCIIPYIPLEYSQGLEVCEDPSKAKEAFKIYEDLVEYNDLEIHPCSFFQSRVKLLKTFVQEDRNTTDHPVKASFRFHTKTMVKTM